MSLDGNVYYLKKKKKNVIYDTLSIDGFVYPRMVHFVFGGYRLFDRGNSGSPPFIG